VSAALPGAVRAAGTSIEVWFQDEARVGQQGTLTQVWAETGSRPRAPKDLRTEWATLFGAVCAERGVGAALVMPHCDAEAMTLHLAEISRAVVAGAHAVVVLDGAGWHQAGGRLKVGTNISLLHLPPYSPELNPVETVWEYLRANKLSNSAFDSYDRIVDRCCAAWNWLADAPDRIRSIAAAPWTKTVTA
jgi:transposase